MSRKFLTIFVLGVTAVVGAMWYRWAIQVWATDVGSETTNVTISSSDTRSNTSGTATGVMMDSVDATTDAHKESKPVDLLSAWQISVTSPDPGARADAIAGLAMAPRERSLPILQNLLKDGAYPDRQLVIESLAILARQQGDADERIRTALRIEIYDGSDDTISAAAKSALVDLEQDLS